MYFAGGSTNPINSSDNTVKLEYWIMFVANQKSHGRMSFL